MKINDYVMVTKPDSELYRRRCQILTIEDDAYTVYSEGLEEKEILTSKDFEPSKF